MMMCYPIEKIAPTARNARISIPLLNNIFLVRNFSNICSTSNIITPKTVATVKRFVMRNGSMGGTKPNMKKIFNIDQIFFPFTWPSTTSFFLFSEPKKHDG